jgi:hypothetical protein
MRLGLAGLTATDVVPGHRDPDARSRVVRAAVAGDVGAHPLNRRQAGLAGGCGPSPSGTPASPRCDTVRRQRVL